MKMWTFSFLLGILACALAHPVKRASQPISTPLGTIIGSTCANHTNVHQYLGIPYAQAPIGDNRFASPKAYQSAYPSREWNANRYRSACPQLNSPLGNVTEEDCLYLNVWVPDRPRQHDLPVRVYIHGGGWYFGASSDALFDGCSATAVSDAILVTFNYRLGVFGFLALPSQANSDHGVGNWAVQDQQLALKWVHDNIHQFGGDNSRIEIFGESAGGSAVSLHLIAKGSEGLFSTAIVESGAASELPPINVAYRSTWAVAQAVGCTTETTVSQTSGEQERVLSCLRSTAALGLLSNGPQLAVISYSNLTALKWGPSIDGHILRRQIPDALAAGEINRGADNTPIMLVAGTNSEEGIILLPQGLNATQSQLDQLIDELAPNRGEYAAYRSVLTTQYSVDRFNGSYFIAGSTLITDFLFLCPTYRFLKAFTRHNKAYSYLFTRSIRCPAVTGGVDLGVVGAGHGMELPYVFQNLALCGLENGEDKELADMMLRAWTSFAATKTPGIDNWDQWTVEDPQIAVLNIPFRTVKHDVSEKCKVFEELVGVAVRESF
ncbi:uncharacterized protein SPPG_02690 [Spizellomyces punctatus DAOM BR117]|uniref:Carboxylic ester hydrolase n=1 Tax=Spizellomyces punctatus (strain DAOM BR117) TaxID=645134 RepID=A0A0L0HMQ6_SPIPD|nr:uncharacterized protein SPPG_02690 [Spizellomyces punctatus DAOM BR117]KND02205.1 hypothetical protein SPPG_02690 [Spizellomyces punctatus DAOM BR117]|eukprot:XP_016610244.1 hypothetical protein SPPG_02690 [Spizellomyces punctatus DAOM BR117]